ncbi:MAG: hypothetical protein RLZZ384_356, partial [Pseudomonadota bacterium]
ILGHAGINISRMQVSAADSQDKAMAVISISESLNADLLSQVADLEAVHEVTQIVL